MHANYSKYVLSSAGEWYCSKVHPRTRDYPQRRRISLHIWVWSRQWSFDFSKNVRNCNFLNRWFSRNTNSFPLILDFSERRLSGLSGNTGNCAMLTILYISGSVKHMLRKKVWKSCFLLLLRASDAKSGWTLLKPRFQDRKRLLWSRTTGFRHECEHSRPEIMSLVHAKCAHMSGFGILFEKKLSENVIWMLSEYLHGPYWWKTYSF